MTNLQTTSNQLTQININNYMDSFISYIDAKPTTITAYKKNLKAFAIWLHDNHIQAPEREDILAYKNYLLATKKPTTTQGYINAVRQFFKWLSYEGIYKNIAENVKGAKLNKDFKKDALTTNQVKLVLSQFKRDTIKSKRDFAIIALCVCCGLRTIELERANVEDLRNLGAYTVLYIQGKGRDEKADFVKVPFECEQALRDYLNARNFKSVKEPLFMSASNNSQEHRLDRGSISRAIKQSFRAVGLNSDRLTAHSLRHTTATISLLNGSTLEETSQLLRHSSINTTMIYNHALDRLKNQSEQRVANEIFK